MDHTFRQLEVVRAEGGRSYADTDPVAVEEPLEVRLEGAPFAVIMRTPGADADLVSGFLLHERVIANAEDIRRVEPVDSAVINVRLSRRRAERLPELLDRRRQTATSSSCGLCGRNSLESLRLDTAVLASSWAVARDVMAGLPATLRGAQTTFAETGGLHAAGIFTVDGALELSAEDVGRHNAVDKVIGRMLTLRRLPLSESILCVSGRSSFEIVQKAFLAGIPLVAAVSAPSTLAVEFAESVGMTLSGFVRDGRFNIYTHGERIVIPDP
jgi:FdhD protein